MDIQNKFFRIALSRAANLVGNRGRMLSLLTQLAIKIRSTKGEALNIHKLRDQFSVIGRMVRAHALGSYKIKSTKLLLSLLAAILYFINPLDLVPDVIFAIGFTDDFAVLAWVYQSALGEIEDFKKWEQAIDESSLEPSVKSS